MNIEGLCAVLTKYLGTEVVAGIKRGARAQHDHVPVPGSDTQFKATFAVQSIDSPGWWHLRRTYNAQVNKLVEILTTEHNAVCGLRIDAYKGADDYAWSTLSQFRTKMGLPSFKKDLRDAGFALADTGRVVKLSSQVADVAFMEFEVTFSEVISSDPELAFIDNVSGTGTVSPGPITLPLKVP